MSQLDELKMFIKTQYPEGTQILGSHLGALVKKDFSELAAQSGGLATLVQKQLSDLLIFAGKKGRDNTYRVINSSSITTASFYTPDDGALWNVFSNPRYQGAICIRNADRTLVKFDTSTPSITHGFTELPRLGDKDIKQIISDFMHNCNACHPIATDGTPPVQVDLGTHYWRNWMQYLRGMTSSNSTVIANWDSYHALAVANTFATRLDHFGFPPKEIEKWNWTLLSSRARLPVENENKPSPSSSISINASEISLRQIIHKAIDKLTDDQLRNVTLPAGILLDGARNS